MEISQPHKGMEFSQFACRTLLSEMELAETRGMDDLELELKVGFLEEAQQLLQDAERCFLEIENSPEDSEITNQLFRLAHNLKGSAKAVGFSELGAFTHLLESLLLKIKNLETKVDAVIVDLLLACKDQLQVMIDGLKTDLSASFDTAALSARLTQAVDGHAPAASSTETVTSGPAPGEDAFSSDEVIPVETLDPAEFQTDFSNEAEVGCAEELELGNVPAADAFFESELIGESTLDLVGDIDSPAELEPSISGSASQLSPEVTRAIRGVAQASLNEAATETVKAEKAKPPVPVDESIRVSLSRVDQLINFVGEMVILQTVLFEQAYGGNIESIRKTVHQLGKISKELQDVSMSLRMVPLKQTFQKMQRIVRDTSRTLDKVVELELQGEETEVEKTVLEMIGDPLVHLVRNAVDHGIDSAQERAASGKPVQGKITLKAYHQADSIVLEVCDDGKGIDADRLRQKAIEKNILKPGQNVTDRQAINLIFHPGFSTKQAVSDISGRGVGLDVVKTNIERLQGTVEVSTELGRGSKFRIQLPLTLAIIDATTVRLNEQRYAIPMSHIHESVQLKPTDIQMSVNIGEIVNLRGENLKVYRLHDLLGVKDDAAEAPRILLVSRIDDKPFGLLVHDISSMQQIVVKKLGLELSSLVGVSGSAVLGDGKPALILDLPRLIQLPQKNNSPKNLNVNRRAAA